MRRCGETDAVSLRLTFSAAQEHVRSIICDGSYYFPLRQTRVHSVREAVVLDPVLTAGIALLKLLHL
jgi:hypothetical protein